MGSLARVNGSRLGTPIDQRLHQRGYELWRAGVQPPEIRRTLKITMPQWTWLLEEGDPHSSPSMPCYRSMLVEEVAAIRNAASEAAVNLATDGVEVLRQRMQNARSANELIHGILQQTAAALVGIRLEPDKEPDKEPDAQMLVALAMPRKPTQEMLKILASIANMGPAAHAYRTIYGDHAAQRALYPLQDAPKRVDGAPLQPIEGEAATREQFLPSDMLDEVIGNLMSWDESEIDAFAEGGEEPPPNR